MILVRELTIEVEVRDSQVQAWSKDPEDWPNLRIDVKGIQGDDEGLSEGIEQAIEESNWIYREIKDEFERTRAEQREDRREQTGLAPSKSDQCQR